MNGTLADLLLKLHFQELIFIGENLAEVKAAIIPISNTDAYQCFIGSNHSLKMSVGFLQRINNSLGVKISRCSQIFTKLYRSKV